MLNRALRLSLLLAVFALVFGFALIPVHVAFAQDAPVVDTPTSEPPTQVFLLPIGPELPSSTPRPGATATPSSTPLPGATATPTPLPGVPAPEPTPVPIPEPVTIALFGTGLAALSGIVARRRNKKD